MEMLKLVGQPAIQVDNSLWEFENLKLEHKWEVKIEDHFHECEKEKEKK